MSNALLQPSRMLNQSLGYGGETSFCDIAKSKTTLVNHCNLYLVGVSSSKPEKEVAVGTRLQGRKAKDAAMTAGLVLAGSSVLIGSAGATIGMTGASLREACWAVSLGAGWGALTFVCGWWVAVRKREHVAAEVAAVLSPVLKELKHLRGALAQRGNVDEHAQTSVHPRRRAPVTDDAKTIAGSFEKLLEAVR